MAENIYKRKPAFIPSGPEEKAANKQLAFEIAQKIGHPNPELFVQMIGHESGFNTRAVSKTGAQGLGQLTSIARKDLAQQGLVPLPVSDEERFDPVKNLTASAQYSKRLYGHFKKLPPALRDTAMLLSYVGGPAATSHYMQTGDASRFRNWEEAKAYPLQVTRNTPFETNASLLANLEKRGRPQLASAPARAGASSVVAAASPPALPPDEASLAKYGITEEMLAKTKQASDPYNLGEVDFSPQADPDLQTDEFKMTVRERNYIKQQIAAIFDVV